MLTSMSRTVAGDVASQVTGLVTAGTQLSIFAGTAVSGKCEQLTATISRKTVSEKVPTEERPFSVDQSSPILQLSDEDTYLVANVHIAGQPVHAIVDTGVTSLAKLCGKFVK